jgi:hypothetical protein
MLKAAIIGSLGSVVKTAGRELAHLQMVGKALATVTFFGAGLIATIAGAKVLLLLTIHLGILLGDQSD